MKGFALVKKTRQALYFPLLLSALLVSLALLSSCQSINGASSPGRDRTRLSGTVVSEGLPINHTTIFLKGKDVRDNREILTRSDGSFVADVLPGHYLISTQPVGYCPIKGEIIVPRSPGQPVPLRIELVRVSFIHCGQGTIILSGKTVDKEGAHLKKPALLSGIINGLPKTPGSSPATLSFFLTAEGPGETTRQVSLDPTGRFIAPPMVAGRYILDLVFSGFCPVHQTLELPAGDSYLQLALTPYQEGKACKTPLARLVLPDGGS
ncbi:MAG: hypothetical protein M0041_04235 [Nitrospiraceae bacterium]|nr:hypothetical protein [Nitrospiraceae bacterium]